MGNKKCIVTARSVQDDQHIFIQCSDVMDAFRTAQKLHRLGEKRYIQVRLRATKPSLRHYRWVDILPFVVNGA